MNGNKLFNDLLGVIEHNQTSDLWCDDYSILTPKEDIHKAILLVFDSLGFHNDLVTGYYDPKEDERDENVDEFTGNYYIELG